jgi:hypothetical protein
LKAILSVVPPGSRILEVGAGEPFIADILDRLDYEVWVVDPYDGTGNGPLECEQFRTGFEEIELRQLIERMSADHETYYLSAESHNRWRGVRSYDEFPMRVCVSIQIISRAAICSYRPVHRATLLLKDRLHPRGVSDPKSRG